MATIYGSNGNDALTDTTANDLMYGLLGDDTLTSNYGIDTLDGGEGNDRLITIRGVASGGNGFDTLIANYKYADYYNVGGIPRGIHLGHLGQKNIKRRDTGGTVLSFDGLESLKVTGTQYDDVLDATYTGTGNDSLYGEGGNDLIYGGSGNDYLDGGAGADTLDGNQGDDTLVGGAGDNLSDTSGNNVFIATEAALITGGAGSKLIADYSQSNYGSGIYLKYNSFGQKIIQVGNTTLLATTGLDQFNIIGTQYDDRFESGDSTATLTGGAGNDVFIGQKGSFSGGSGTDTLIIDYSNYAAHPYGVYFSSSTSSNLILQSGTSNTLLSYEGIEVLNVTGSKYNDLLRGGSGDDVLNGLGGDDVVSGREGNDVLYGGDGNDIINGGAGNDILFDGSGSDTFIGGAGDDYIYAIADVQGKNKSISGNEGADTFVLDLKGSIGLGFNFNVQTLGNFVNKVTLPPDEGFQGLLNWKRMGVDLGLSLFGATAGSVPVVGGAAEFFMTKALTLVLSDYLSLDEIHNKIQQQETNATEAVNQYASADWGSVTVTGVRDTITIEDFQVGLDSIVLPKLTSLSQRYRVNLDNNIIGGATVSIVGVDPNDPTNPNKGPELVKDAVFIKNNYKNFGLSDGNFQHLIADLIDGTTIGTFKKSPLLGINNAIGINTIEGSFARDIIQGDKTEIGDLGGDDLILGNYGDDVIQGFYGNDTIFGGNNINFTLNPNTDFKQLEDAYGSDGYDTISGGLGNDKLYGETGNDYLVGDEGNDSLYGGVGNDSLKGGIGNDQLEGGEGNDTLDGGDGNDTLKGGTGNDSLKGGIGNDNLVAGIGINIVDGGSGTDTLVADYTQSSYFGVHLGWLGQNAIFGRNNEGVVLSHTGVEKFQITGTKYDDAFEGRSFNDTFKGGDGNDYLGGAGGNDSLLGGNGNDLLIGGTGNDTLTGGTGADRFAFDQPVNLSLRASNLDSGIDRITDFNSLQGDKIQIQASFGASSLNQFSFDATTGGLFFNTSASGNVQFATLQGVSTFNVATDVVLV